MHHRDLGEVTHVLPALKFSASPQTAHEVASWHAPDIGENSKDVLKDLGFSCEDPLDRWAPTIQFSFLKNFACWLLSCHGPCVVDFSAFQMNPLEIIP